MSVFDETEEVTETATKFAIRIRKARKQVGLSQNQVAAKLGKAGHSSVVNWEKGTATPTVKDFVVLCEIYQVTPNEILLD